MKRNIFLTSIIFILLVFLSSCGLSPMEEGRSVNEYIFPYVKFEPSKDGSYCTATIVSGAKVSDVYIPAASEDNENPTLPVMVFKGFENEEDMVNLKSVTIESSITVIEKGCLDKAVNLSRITYNSVENRDDEWTDLPWLEHTEEGEFHGWLIMRSGAEVNSEDNIVRGYSAIYPNWGTHTFVEHPGVEPTCTTAGYTAYHNCSNKIKVRDENGKDKYIDCTYTTKVVLPALGHDLVKHEKSDADCSSWSVGYSETCWECTRCGAFFSDSEGKTTVDKESVVIGPRHTESGDIAYNEESHWYVCSVCGKKFFGNANAPEAHSFNVWSVSEDGKYSVSKCETCPYVTKELIQHEKTDWTEVPEVEPTCTESGHLRYYECTKHKGHCYTLSIEDVEIIRDKKTLEEQIYLRPLGHLFEEGEYKWNSTVHWQVCQREGCNGTSEKENHVFEYTFEVDEKARSMIVTRECVVCKKEFSTDPSGTQSAFDIATAFGDIAITKTKSNTWALSYTKSGAYDCYWTDNTGQKLITGTDPFSLSYAGGGKGRIIVYCHELDEKGKEVDVAFAVLTTY